MSAFVGIINLDGAPVERPYLDKMASYMSRIGPDRQQVWVESQAGMAHALLKTTSDTIISQQPFSLGDYVIVGDVRIDDRQKLLAELAAKGIAGIDHKQDVEIILHAWVLWKEKLTEHLIGDFSLAIWNRKEKKLFCLRDHMGVRPFYYARVGNIFLYSNTLNCLRQHSAIDATFNDLTVMDFLVFGHNLEFSTTIFKNIQQLAPAHFMEVSSSGTHIQRYWSLTCGSVIRYRNANDYVEHFRQLLDTAVADRLSTGNVGVAMSGGLDSTSIAACAHELLSAPNKLSLYTLEIKSLWPDDQEEKYAGLLASKLGVDLHIQSANREELFQDDMDTDWLLPEPSRDAFRVPIMSVFREMATQNPVGLTGHGADSLLTPSPNHFDRLRKKNQWLRLLRDAHQYVQVLHKRPPLNIRSKLKKKFEKAPWRPTLPRWLQADMLVKTDFTERYNQKLDELFAPDSDIQSERPEAYRDLCSPIWPATLLRFDPQTSGVPVDFRHPYFDLRLLEFVLAMPAMPWFHKKQILRMAMTGSLPDSIRTRLKAMPQISPVYRGMTENPDFYWQKHIPNLKSASQYIDLVKFQKQLMYTQSLKSEEADRVLLPLAFGNWLRQNSL